MSGTQNRITIQLDLSGYSFTIYGRNGSILTQESHSCPVDLSVQELAPVLRRQYASVSVYFTTWKYTLVPLSLFDRENVRGYLEAVRDLSRDDRVLSLEMPSHKAAMVYAVPYLIYSGITGLCRNVRFYPTAYVLIDRVGSIQDNNHLLVSFTDGMLHIAAAERDRLLFANSFPAADMATAEYFIFSVTKEVLFNPEHTVLYIVGKADGKAEQELGKYFAGVQHLA